MEGEDPIRGSTEKIGSFLFVFLRRCYDRICPAAKVIRFLELRRGLYHVVPHLRTVADLDLRSRDEKAVDTISLVMDRHEIFFKKQMLGQWRRTDQDGSKHVNEEAMFREIQKLVNDGWSVEPQGITHVRAIVLHKNERRI